MLWGKVNIWSTYKLKYWVLLISFSWHRWYYIPLLVCYIDNQGLQYGIQPAIGYPVDFPVWMVRMFHYLTPQTVTESLSLDSMFFSSLNVLLTSFSNIFKSLSFFWDSFYLKIKEQWQSALSTTNIANFDF